MMLLISVSLEAPGLDPIFQVVGKKMAGTKLSVMRFVVILKTINKFTRDWYNSG